MTTLRSRDLVDRNHPSKSSSLSSLSSYLPLSPPVASSSKLSYFPPFIPSEPPPIVPQRSHRKGKSLSAIAGWSLGGLGFTLASASGCTTPESLEPQESGSRPQTPIEALSSSLHPSRHSISSSSSRHVLQPVLDGHDQINRSRSLRQRAKRPEIAQGRENECGMERDRRRGMELLLGVLGSKANGSEESLVDCVSSEKSGKKSTIREHRATRSSRSGDLTPASVRSPSRQPFKPSNPTPEPGLRRSNSARAPTQPPSYFLPLPPLQPAPRKAKPPLRLSLSHPSWSRPTPSPPVTSLSPSLTNDLFDWKVENPIAFGGPWERTNSDTETLKPSTLTPRASRLNSAMRIPPDISVSSESESEDGVLRTPCLSSTPVLMATMQMPARQAKKPVKAVERAPWR